METEKTVPAKDSKAPYQVVFVSKDYDSMQRGKATSILAKNLTFHDAVAKYHESVQQSFQGVQVLDADGRAVEQEDLV